MYWFDDGWLKFESEANRVCQPLSNLLVMWDITNHDGLIQSMLIEKDSIVYIVTCTNQ